MMEIHKITRLSGLWLALLTIPPLHAQRETSSFDRDWLFARFGAQADGSYREEPCLRPSSPVFCDTSWRKLDVPHDWGIEGPFRNDLEGSTGKLPWRGIGWYRKHFRLPTHNRDSRFYLDFDGTMANAEIWLNGNKVGERPYGYSSFRIDLTPYLRHEGDNILSVRLDTENLGSRWYPGAGIYRHVRLVRTEPIHVAQWGVYVTTPKISAQEAEVCVRVTLENHTSTDIPAYYTVSLHRMNTDGTVGRQVCASPAQRINIPAETSGTDSTQLRVKSPRLWSTETPNRYVARVLVCDETGKALDNYDTPFGFRTIAFTHDDGFHLNGHRVPINGVCLHHDLGALGAAMNTTALRRQLTMLKSMGCNAIRTSHNPPAPELLNLADELGMLVMDELFDCWRAGKNKHDYSVHFDRWHEEDVRSLVCRDRNHPCVILWSTGNEVPEQYHPNTGLAAHLREVIRRHDATRPVTLGISGPKHAAMNGTEMQLDVVGVNYPAGVQGGEDFFGNFFGKPEHATLPIFTSESASTLSSRGEYFPRRFQVNSYDNTEPGWASIPDREFEELDKYPAVAGEFVWTGFDYLGEPTPFNSDRSVLLNHVSNMSKEELAAERARLEEIEKNRPTSRSSYFGIIDLAGFPKDRYYLYRSRWVPDEPTVHVLPHWNFTGREGEIIPVSVYTSGDEAELFLNGRSQGRRHKGEFEYRLTWDSVRYEPGTIKVVAYRNGRKWGTTQRETTGSAARLTVTTDRRQLTSDGNELAFLTIAVTDKEGRTVPDANIPVRCHVEGEGELVATDNGDATCHITFSSPCRPTFNGLMLAIVKARPGTKGTLRLVAEADGMPTASLSLKVKKP